MKSGFKVDLNSRSTLKSCHSLSVGCHTWGNVCDRLYLLLGAEQLTLKF